MQLQEDAKPLLLDGDSPLYYNRAMLPARKNVRSIVKTEAFKWLNSLGIRRLKHFFDADGRLLKIGDALELGLPSGAVFEWKRMTRLVDAIVKEKECAPQAHDYKQRLGELRIHWRDASQKNILADQITPLDNKLSTVQQ